MFPPTAAPRARHQVGVRGHPSTLNRSSVMGHRPERLRAVGGHAYRALTCTASGEQYGTYASGEVREIARQSIAFWATQRWWWCRLVQWTKTTRSWPNSAPTTEHARRSTTSGGNGALLLDALTAATGPKRRCEARDLGPCHSEPTAQRMRPCIQLNVVRSQASVRWN